MPIRPWLTVATLCAIAVALGGCAHTRQAGAYDSARGSAAASAPYAQDAIMDQANNFFGQSAHGLASVINRLFRDNGQPDAYIKGEEGGGSIGVGLRYGHGTLYYKDGTSANVYWRGPSIGIDFGGSASKTFILIYHLPDIDALYQRFGGVEGSLYFVGGVGFTYNKSDNILLAPVRVGIGWRQGISVGYLHFSPKRSWLPF